MQEVKRRLETGARSANGKGKGASAQASSPMSISEEDIKLAVEKVSILGNILVIC